MTTANANGRLVFGARKQVLRLGINIKLGAIDTLGAPEYCSTCKDDGTDREDKSMSETIILECDEIEPISITVPYHNCIQDSCDCLAEAIRSLWCQAGRPLHFTIVTKDNRIKF